MNKAATDILMDVIALSKKQCQYPIEGCLAYATHKNFIGRIIDGYFADAADICLLSKQAALALCGVQNDLLEKNIGLYIYDAYRPLRAVKDFVRWFHQPVITESEIIRKLIHYPSLKKTDLARLGYIADTVSRHNFGHAVDLVLIDRHTHQFLDMGACFDFFDDLSHTDVTEDQIGVEAYNNRLLLSMTMKKHHFIPYENEFWHFDYMIRETDDPMDIPITKELKNLNLY